MVSCILVFRIIFRLAANRLRLIQAAIFPENDNNLQKYNLRVTIFGTTF